MIYRLIVFSVLSGIWTTLFAILDMVTVSHHDNSDISCAHVAFQYLGFPNTAVYVLFDLPLCSLYCNTLLVSLNSRDSGSAASIKELSTFKAASRPVIISMEREHSSNLSDDIESICMSDSDIV